MEELELWNLLVELEEKKINTSEAHNQILRLFNVSGRSEQLLAFAQWHAKEPFTREEHQDLGKRIERYLSQ